MVCLFLGEGEEGEGGEEDGAEEADGQPVKRPAEDEVGLITLSPL